MFTYHGTDITQLDEVDFLAWLAEVEPADGVPVAAPAIADNLVIPF